MHLSYSYLLLVLYFLVFLHSPLDYVGPLIVSQAPLQVLQLLHLVLPWVMVLVLLLLLGMPPIVLLALHYPLYIVFLDPPIHNSYHQIQSYHTSSYAPSIPINWLVLRLQHHNHPNVQHPACDTST